jgi:site-specific DNA-methyltransferase (adenine-specific)
MTPYYEHHGITIYHGDCLDVMPALSDPVDLILADLPYGTTACAWDSVIPLDKLWAQYRRLIKPDGAIVLTATQPFTSVLVMSNLAWFKYCWVWRKTKAANFHNAPNMPLKLHEDICVFSSGTCANRSPRRMVYNPQGVTAVEQVWHRPQKYESAHRRSRPSDKLRRIVTRTGFPESVLDFPSVHNPPHPTQKPQALMEYLILTYSNPGDLVLDNTMGRGTTLAAAKKLGRRAIGIEQDATYCDVAIERLQQDVLPLGDVV